MRGERETVGLARCSFSCPKRAQNKVQVKPRTAARRLSPAGFHQLLDFVGCEAVFSLWLLLLLSLLDIKMLAWKHKPSWRRVQISTTLSTAGATQAQRRQIGCTNLEE